MYAPTLANIPRKSPIALWLCLALTLTPTVFADFEGEDCDEFWSNTMGPLDFSDNCDYILGPIGPGSSLLPEGSVTQDLRPTCPDGLPLPRYRMSFRFLVDTRQLSMSLGDRFGLFELWADGGTERLVYVELEERGLIESKHGLILNWQADGLSSGQEVPTAIVEPGDVFLEIEWIRSFDFDDDGLIDNNGVIRLFLNDSLIAEVTGVRIEQRLPEAVSYGVFDALGTGIEGTLRFQPQDFSVRYYRYQGPVSGLP